LLFLVDKRHEFEVVGDLTKSEAFSLIDQQAKLDGFDVSTEDKDAIVEQIGARPVDLSRICGNIKDGLSPQGSLSRCCVVCACCQLIA
jgi:hypothetical protein